MRMDVLRTAPAIANGTEQLASMNRGDCMIV